MISMIPSYSNRGQLRGKGRYSNTAPRFPFVLYPNPVSHSRLGVKFLAQPARARAPTRTHTRTHTVRGTEWAQGTSKSVPPYDYKGSHEITRLQR